MRRISAIAVLVTLALAGAAALSDEKKKEDVDLNAWARTRIAQEKAALDKAEPLPADKAPAWDEGKKQHLCPADKTLLRAVIESTGGTVTHLGLLCEKEWVLYVGAPGSEPGKSAWKGPVRLWPASRDAVLKALQRHLSDSGQQGFYTGRFGRIVRMGPEAATFLLDIFKTEANGTLRSLALDALGEVGNKAAIPELAKVLQDPELQSYHMSAAASMALLGDTSAVDRMAAELSKIADDKERPVEQRGGAFSQLALLRSRINQNDKAIELYLKALELVPDAAIVHYNLACAYAVLKRADDAFKSLETAIAKGYTEFEWMRMDGDLASLRSDPRWKKLLERGAPKKEEEKKEQPKEEKKEQPPEPPKEDPKEQGR